MGADDTDDSANVEDADMEMGGVGLVQVLQKERKDVTGLCNK